MPDFNVPGICAALTVVLTLICSTLLFSDLMGYGRVRKKRAKIIVTGTVSGLLLYFAIGLPVAIAQNQAATTVVNGTQDPSSLGYYLFAMLAVLIAGCAGALIALLIDD